MVQLKGYDDTDMQGWCGVGALVQPVTVGYEAGKPLELMRGWRITMLSAQSDLRKATPPVEEGDVVMAMKDERYGDRWIPMLMVDEKRPLEDGRVPHLIGPQDSMVQLRVRKFGSGQMVDVEVMRRAFDQVRGVNDEVTSIVLSRNATQGCVMSQLPDMEPLKRLAWQDVDAVAMVPHAGEAARSVRMR